MNGQDNNMWIGICSTFLLVPQHVGESYRYFPDTGIQQKVMHKVITLSYLISYRLNRRFIYRFNHLCRGENVMFVCVVKLQITT